MTIDRSLLPLTIATVGIVLAACGGVGADDDRAADGVTSTPPAASPSVDESDGDPASAEESDPPAPSEQDDPDASPSEEEPADQESATDEPTVEQSEDGDADTESAADDIDDEELTARWPEAASIAIDGTILDITYACNGVDGAVLADLTDGSSVALIGEEGPALEYRAPDGTESSTADVELVGESTYVGVVDGETAREISLELRDTSLLPDC